MQSGPIVLVRAVVMLACMIVVPLVAVFWKHWPEAIDLARNGEWAELTELGLKIVTRSGPQPSTAHQPAQNAPVFGAATATPSAGLIANPTPAAMAVPMPAAAVPSPPQLMPEVAGNLGAIGPTIPEQQPAVATAGFTTPVKVGEPGIMAGAPKPGLAEPPQAFPGHLAQVTATPSTIPPQDSSEANPFRALEQRLRTLGATYYLLESWGTEGNLYRFHVKMALAGNPSYNRHFEATDADPLQAMRHVLAEVEAWRSGQQL